MAHGYTPEELALLSDEEREGLLSQEQDDKDELEQDGLPATNADDDKDPKDDKDGGAAEDQTLPAAAVAAAAAAAQPAAAAEPIVEAEIVPAPAKYVLPLADLDTKITSARTEQEQLAVKFDEGDLSAIEYQKANRALDDHIATLRETKLKSTMSFDARKDDWLNVTAPAWLDQHPHYRANDALFAQLNEQVMKLQETTFATNVFDPRIMDIAHARLVDTFRQMGLEAPGGGTKPGGKGGTRPMPPNIGGLPQAGEDDLGDGGRFGALDRLMDTDQLAWEAELARMSPADRDAYNAAR